MYICICSDVVCIYVWNGWEFNLIIWRKKFIIGVVLLKDLNEFGIIKWFEDWCWIN